jgi:predicted Zn-dependent peptidase
LPTEKIKESTTKNGIKVITESIPTYHTVAVGVCGNFGSRDETDNLSGITHLIEHLFFKGTKTRTPRDIAREIEQFGGMINAFTGREHICIISRIIDTHLDTAVELISDLILNSTISTESILKEKQVIYSEIQSIDDDPMTKVQDMLLQNLFSDDPLGRLISGTVESVSQFEREHIVGYLAKKLTPENIHVVVSGNVEHRLVKKIVDEKIDDNFVWSGDLPSLKNKYKYFNNLEDRDTELANIAMAVKTTGLQNGGDEKYILPILSTIIGGNLSSRLFQRVREEMGLAYHLGAFCKLYSDVGFFNISFSVPSELVSKVLEIITEILKEPITEDELEMTKEYTKGTITLSLESLSNRMMRLSRQLQYFNRLIPIEETIKKIDSISLDAVNKVLSEKILSQNFSYAIISPDSEKLSKEVEEYV